MWNPKQNRVVTKITINGEIVSGSGIVLNPGQRVYIERFLDIDRKFKFVTYAVENSQEAMNAIAKNGNVSVEFFDEIFNHLTITNYPTYMYTNNFGIGSNISGTLYCQDISSSTTNVGNIAAGSINTTNLGNSVCEDFTETGRVEKGEKSNQNFDTTIGDFSFFACASYFIKILPKSKQPIEASEIRAYCTECGRRWRSTDKFCANCGASRK